MIRWVMIVLCGLLGGVLAGMGFGGGTLTIPLLVLALGVGQIEAQAVNLVAFLPTGCAALFVHDKNGLIVLKDLLFVIVPAVICSLVASVFAVRIDGVILKKIFGGFLVAVAISSLVCKMVKIAKIGYLH